MPDISELNGTAIANVAEFDALTVTEAPAFTGLLDETYGSGAAAAYSTRRLASATTVLLRVRRDTGTGGSEDDDEADVAYDSNNELSLDSAISNASAGVTATTLGQFINVGEVNSIVYSNPDSLTVTASCYVDTWYDQAGSNDAVQDAEGSQPQIHDGTVNTDLITENGKPALDFDGTNDGLNCSTNLRTSTGASTVIQVRNVPLRSSLQQPFGFYKIQRHLSYNDANYRNISISTNETAGEYMRFTDANLSDQLLHFATWDGSTQTDGVDEVVLYQDGAQETGTGRSYDFAVMPSASNSIGFRNDTSTQYCLGTFQEVIVYLTDQTSNRTAIQTDINGHFSIY